MGRNGCQRWHAGCALFSAALPGDIAIAWRPHRSCANSETNPFCCSPQRSLSSGKSKAT